MRRNNNWRKEFAPQKKEGQYVTLIEVFPRMDERGKWIYTIVHGRRYAGMALEPLETPTQRLNLSDGDKQACMFVHGVSIPLHEAQRIARGVIYGAW